MVDKATVQKVSVVSPHYDERYWRQNAEDYRRPLDLNAQETHSCYWC